MIPMNHSFKTYWDFFILVLAFYNCFEIPFEIAFNPEFIQTTFI